MDDCNSLSVSYLPRMNFVQIPLWTIVTCGSIFDCVTSNVQIPLWTIVTLWQKQDLQGALCSDSSMDDCNGAICPSERRSNSSSDSSMDDCNGAGPACRRPIARVQIPLWTIVTGLRLGEADGLGEFRFLYGRL